MIQKNKNRDDGHWRKPANSFEYRHIFLRKMMNGDHDLTDRDIKKKCVFTEGLTLDNRSRDFIKEAVLHGASEFYEKNRIRFRIVIPTLRGLSKAADYVRGNLVDEFIRHFDGKRLRVYCGLSTYFIPEVYNFILKNIFGNSRHYAAVERFEDILYRLEEMEEFAFREFTQLKELRDGQSGSRSVDISKEEYRHRLLEMEYRDLCVKSQSRCIICNKKYSKENKGEMSIHHIVGKGAFRHIKRLFVEQEFFDSKDRSRGVANFGSNQVWMCRKCHDGIEQSINFHVLVENPDSNIGRLFVADLYIILARKIAHYSVVDTKLPNLYLYYDTMMIEGLFFVDSYMNHLLRDLDSTTSHQAVQKDHHP